MIGLCISLFKGLAQDVTPVLGGAGSGQPETTSTPQVTVPHG